MYMKKNKSVIILLTTSLFVLTIIILEIKISSRSKSYNNEKECIKNLSDMITKNIKLSQKMLENIKNKGIEVVDIKIDECLANSDEENNFIKNLENLVIVNYVDTNITVCTENKNCSLYRYLSYFGGISRRFSWANYRTYNLLTYFNIFHISDFNDGHVLHILIPEYINLKNINPSFENIKQHITKVLLTGLMELPFKDNKKTFLITFPTLINEFKLGLYNMPNNPLFKKYYYSEVWLGLLEAVYQYDNPDRIVLNLDPNDIII